MSEKETILITGAGGFIGGWIAETLALDGTSSARAGIRSWASAARLARFPVDIVLCDVMDKDSLARAMRGANRVIHCVSGSVEAIVRGTANLLDVAQDQNVRRFVHLSTTEVYGDAAGRVDEAFPLLKVGDVYGDAKIEAEELCWERAAKGLPVSVVRPSIVYGPFSRDWTAGFAARLRSGNWRVFKGYGDGICNLVYVSDLVSGILLAAHHERAVGEAFNLVGPETTTWNEYFRKFNAALGLPELREIDPSRARFRAAALNPVRRTGKLVLKHFRAPLRKLSQGHRIARGLLQYADRSLKTTPRMAELSLYNRNAEYSAAKARDLLGYEPRFGVDRGLELSVGWLENVGLSERGS